jgi:hypothetical protein
MPADTIPDFDTAHDLFRRFLQDQKAYGDVRWVRPTDIVVWKSQLYLSSPVSAESDLRAMYARGQERGLGMCLQMISVSKSRPCCCVSFPEDQLAAEYQMCFGLKLSCPTKISEAREIKNPVLWAILKRLGHTFADFQNLRNP